MMMNLRSKGRMSSRMELSVIMMDRRKWMKRMKRMRMLRIGIAKRRDDRRL